MYENKFTKRNDQDEEEEEYEAAKGNKRMKMEKAWCLKQKCVYVKRNGNKYKGTTRTCSYRKRSFCVHVCVKIFEFPTVG